MQENRGQNLAPALPFFPFVFQLSAVAACQFITPDAAYLVFDLALLASAIDPGLSGCMETSRSYTL
jgi:hypothetical protein